MTTYRNPIQRAGDFADPFVLRHDGRYYLYCTNPDVRCWSSRDLVDWHLEGPTIEEDAFPGLVPFAPEVVYADGYFYMYTSPSGHGHFVLRSDSPTGPFRLISGNVGHAIDGNVFIDDDGRWYFYWAGDEGIWGCEMSSPTEFGPPVFTGIHMNGWTEGPFVSKRDDVYHMTLTGNHYLSPGYRIDAAYSLDPLSGYRADPLNPVVIGADGPNVGLGHSSTVTGPDLVSTYVVYHNLNSDESRDLDIDRQVWSGQSLQVLGPTTSAPAPAVPDAEWEGTADPAVSADVFTAELNLTAPKSGGSYGLSLGDALTIRVGREAGTVNAVDPARDATLASRELPHGFVHHALHCWRVVYDHGELRVFLDGRLQLSLRHNLPAGSPLRAFATDGDIRIGHCAMTRAVAATADRTAVKPIPGRFWAALGLGGGAGPEIVPAGDVPYDVIRLRPGTSLGYDLHVQAPGRHRVYVAGEFATGDVIIISIHDWQHELRLNRPSSLISVLVDLDAEQSRLTLQGVEGDPVAALVTVVPWHEPRAVTIDDERVSGFGKRILDTGTWDDFTLTATVSFALESTDAHADLIFRATQLSEGGEGNDTRLGIDFLLGYSIQLHADRVMLARHGYDERVLAVRELSIDPSGSHLLRVRAIGGSFELEIDGLEVLHLDDALPYPFGHVGIRTYNAFLHVETLQVEPKP